VERFLSDLETLTFLVSELDVRENIGFQGGHFSRWTHQSSLGQRAWWRLRVKKFFMDEWTNELDLTQLDAIRCATPVHYCLVCWRRSSRLAPVLR